MDEETIMRAKLFAAVICRVVDYHALRNCKHRVPPQEAFDALNHAEQRVAVAIENALDAGLE